MIGRKYTKKNKSTSDMHTGTVTRFLKMANHHVRTDNGIIMLKHLQGHVAYRNVDGVEDRKHEHDHVSFSPSLAGEKRPDFQN